MKKSINYKGQLFQAEISINTTAKNAVLITVNKTRQFIVLPGLKNEDSIRRVRKQIPSVVGNKHKATRLMNTLWGIVKGEVEHRIGVYLSETQTA